MWVAASPVNLFFLPSCLVLEGNCRIAPFFPRWIRISLLKAIRTFWLHLGESFISTNGETNWMGITLTKYSVYQNWDKILIFWLPIQVSEPQGILRHQPEKKKKKEASNTDTIYQKCPPSLFFQIPALILFLSLSLCLLICLFLILHLWFLCLKSFSISFSLSIKTQLWEVLWSKWKGESLVD